VELHERSEAGLPADHQDQEWNYRSRKLFNAFKARLFARANNERDLEMARELSAPARKANARRLRARQEAVTWKANGPPGYHPGRPVFFVSPAEPTKTGQHVSNSHSTRKEITVSNCEYKPPLAPSKATAEEQLYKIARTAMTGRDAALVESPCEEDFDNIIFFVRGKVICDLLGSAGEEMENLVEKAFNAVDPVTLSARDTLVFT
jgi:hypothetical protein